MGKGTAANDDVDKAMHSITQMIPAGTRNKPSSIGHYRTQSQSFNEETSQRIQQYLKQRQAYTRAQALNKSLS